MRALKKLSGWLLATLVVGVAGVPLGGGIAAVHAAEAGRWSALADTVFEYLARDNDLPNSTAPTALAEDGAAFCGSAPRTGWPAGTATTSAATRRTPRFRAP